MAAEKKEAGVYDTKVVYATATAPHHREGEEVTASINVADKMIANGWATEEAAKAKK